MRTPRTYSYAASIKSDASDELINVYVMRHVAGFLVRFLYATPVTPNQITVLAMIAGFVGGALYLQGTPGWTAAAGLCVTLKDLLDSADGQLARAKHMYSRSGRFLDSLGDFFVNLAIFGAIAVTVSTRDTMLGALALVGFLGITLRVSYHVFYQSSYLHRQGGYGLNRIMEEITEEDRKGDVWTLRLQSAFLVLYGWQDRLMARLDGWCRQGIARNPEAEKRWYEDQLGLRLSGFLGLGTELLLLTACSLADRLTLYLWLNAILMNGFWLVCIVYRKGVLTRRSAAQESPWTQHYS